MMLTMDLLSLPPFTNIYQVSHFMLSPTLGTCFLTQGPSPTLVENTGMQTSNHNTV